MDDFVVSKITGYYNFIVHDLADKRSKEYFLIQNPFHVAFISFAYIYFVQKLGPHLMKNREPFQLKTVMIIYNIVQIVANFSLFSLIIYYAYGPTGKYSFICEPVNYSDSFEGNLAVRLFYCFYMLKLLDLLDTVFMVLMKKFDHITFLHVYHHAGMFSFSWGVVKYFPGGHGAFTGMINTFVHVVMYSYYLLTLIWPPEKRKLLWWKKYLTLLQISQFAIVAIHLCLPLFSDCDFPKLRSITLVLPQVLFLSVLFSDYYMKAYLKSNNTQKSQTEIKKTF